MKIDQSIISKLENLARLELSVEEKQQLEQELNQMLDMVAQLQSVPTEGVEPLVYISEATNGFREDKVQHQVTTEAAMKNAPDHDGTYFRVPKVIDL